MSTPAAPLRTLRVAAAYLVRGVARGGCERVEERGVRVRARGKVGLHFITGIKENQNGTRAARTHVRITSTLTQQIKERKKERKQTTQGRDGRTARQKERKKTDNPREGWEDGTPPPHRDFKERCVVR